MTMCDSERREGVKSWRRVIAITASTRSMRTKYIIFSIRTVVGVPLISVTIDEVKVVRLAPDEVPVGSSRERREGR